jgi:hypothetical protein
MRKPFEVWARSVPFLGKENAMWKLVDEYSLNWRANQNSGIIWLKLNDGTSANVQPDSVQELTALADILRNEKPVYYHTVSGDLSTGWEPLGEAEA